MVFDFYTLCIYIYKSYKHINQKVQQRCTDLTRGWTESCRDWALWAPGVAREAGGHLLTHEAWD